MAGLGTQEQNWRARLWAELQRDKKKTVLLAALAVVAVVVLVRLIAQSAGPSTAGAETAVAAPQAGAMPGPVAAGAPAAGAPHATALLPSDPHHGSFFSTKDPRSARPRVKISQDIFAPQLSRFPAEEAKPTPSPTPAATSQSADPEKVRREAILASAKGLSLQSTIDFGEPKAILNGQVAGIGDTVAGFKIIRVTAHSCVVAQDGVQVTLEMKDQ